MANPPDLATGDLTAPKAGVPQTPLEETPVEDERRETIEMWVTGTEEPDWVARSTHEGAQLMLEDESAAELAEQRGTIVEDDFVVADDADEDEVQILNMGPQHPSTHGVLRLQLELEGEKVRRIKPIRATSTPAWRRPAKC